MVVELGMVPTKLLSAEIGYTSKLETWLQRCGVEKTKKKESIWKPTYLDKVIEQAQDDDSNRAEATTIEGCRSKFMRCSTEWSTISP